MTVGLRLRSPARFDSPGSPIQGIANQFLQNPLDPGNLEISILLYGLPMTHPQKIGPFIVQRFQRAAFQRWVESVPGQPVPGTVTQVFAGILYKEANLIPMEAFRPEPNPFDKPSDELLAQARSLLAEQQVTAHLVPYLEHAIIGYAPDLLDTAALRSRQLGSDLLASGAQGRALRGAGGGSRPPGHVPGSTHSLTGAFGTHARDV